MIPGFSTYTSPLPNDAPTDRRIEAYAWGRLARYTGIPALGRIGDALVKVLWFALAPFGLANTAYWSRTQIGAVGSESPPGDSPGARQNREVERQLAGTIGSGAGAGTVRLFGLLLTLLFMTTATAGWLVGMLALFKVGTAQATTGVGQEFIYIICAVVGGCLLTGGFGSAVGAAFGALIYGMTYQGIVYAGWDNNWLKAFLGIMLLAAVLINWYIGKRTGARK